MDIIHLSMGYKSKLDMAIFILNENGDYRNMDFKSNIGINYFN